MKYERQIVRLSRMIWRTGKGALYLNEKGPVARLPGSEPDGVLVGIYADVDPLRILEDIEETKAELGLPFRRYVKGKL